jgi:NifU-like protein involved in Fe-S cluster formation
MVTMSRFSETLMDHFQSPMSRGAMELPHLVGKGSLDGYPPFLTLYLRLEGDRVVDATFEAEGCGVTIACGSVLTEVVRGGSLAKCGQITVRDLAAALDGLPVGKEYCAEVAIRALKDALRGVDRQTAKRDSDICGIEQEGAETAEKTGWWERRLGTLISAG